MSRSSAIRRFSAVGVATMLLVTTAVIGVNSASAQVKSLKISSSFLYITQPLGARCGWGIGIIFPEVPGAVSYSVNYFDGYYNAEEFGSVTAPVPASSKYHGVPYFGITGGQGPSPCAAADATEGGRFRKAPVVYANFAVPDNKGYISGIVTNKDGNGVEGATLTTYGPEHASAVSGPGGVYLIKVKAGHYRVVPDDPAIKSASFTPTYRDANVAKDATTTVNFTIDAGLQLTMDFSSYKVAASGFAIVRGTILTTQYGKPAPAINVELSVDPTNPSASITTDPKVALCGPTGRIWPSGSISTLSASSVNVTTDGSGKYDFTMTVGTKPGTWQLDAWAKNADGTLSSDTTKASETKDLTIDPLHPTTSLADFLTHVQELKGTPVASDLTPDSPASFATVMGQLALKYGSYFGGLTFSEGGASDGANVVVAPATTDWQILSSGEVRANPSELKALVLDPQEWTGASLSKITSFANNLNLVMQAGLLTNAPTVHEWESGSTANPGWALKTNILNDPQGSLIGFGWAYGPVAAAPKGYCN